jgi:predicted NAD/FAD-binding protein
MMAEDEEQLQVRYVAIVGGGIGGLAAAYFLHGRRSADGREVFQCEVFEKQARLGGNGLSAYLDRPFQKRFADLGVNDFNLTTYRIMGDVLRQMAADGYPVRHEALTDSACFYTIRGEAGTPLAFTTEELANPTTEITRRIAADQKKFAGLVNAVMKQPRYAAMSVGEFLSTEGFSPEFRDFYMLPRINGMYFMGETVPEAMPIRGVMSYYHFQEGVGAGAPNRRYFFDGCSAWIRQLQSLLEARGVRFHLSDSPVVVARGPGAVHVSSAGSARATWDAVISAVPADEVANVVALGLPPLMPLLLAQFRYADGIAIAHVSDAAMPPDRSRWRTYNIRIFPPRTRLLRPYTIAYVETMHQGAKTPDDPPPYFVSENPPVPIPEEQILDMIDLATGERTKAVAYFRHNTVSVDSMGAQRMLSTMQGQNGVWYTGGWTNGAGLHEEIMAVSQEIALKLRGYIPLDRPLHTYSDRDPAFVPKYVRDSLQGEAAAAAPAGFWEG